MRKAITILLALVMVLSLAACGGGSTTTNTPAPTEAPATPEPTPEPTPDPDYDAAQEFACKFITSLAHTFVNPLSVNVKKAWYYKDSIDYYFFTFQLDVDNSAGITQTVYYGNKTLGFKELTDDTISNARNSTALGVGSYFVENAIDAMQKGNELDAAAIQEYFLKNYK